MTKEKKMLGTEQAWDSRILGCDIKYAKPTKPESALAIDESLGLQMISIRLNKELIAAFKVIGEHHGVGYQPLMRDALQRFATAELKSIVTAGLASQKKKSTAQVKTPEGSSKPIKKVA
jgi:uncharacterized protein (DUF4415 family)